MGRRERGIITPYEFQELRRLYTFREIAKIKGYTESGLFRWCNRNNVITSRIANWEIAEEIKNKTPKEIAYEYNISLEICLLEIKKNGHKSKITKGDKMITVYLSGKMTGLAESEYRENFRKGEQFYKACGYNVINPCDLAAVVLERKPDATYEDFLREDLRALSECTHIAMLEGWETSPGAKREKAEAERLGLEVMYYRTIGGKK